MPTLLNRPAYVSEATESSLKYILACITAADWLCQWHPTAVPFKT